jgi:hypothetical protein
MGFGFSLCSKEPIMPWKDKYEKFKDGAKYQEITAHLEENKTLYVAAGGMLFAGITCLIMRGIASQSIGSSITGTADHGITVIGKKIAMNNVSYISANRQGPPSWVVRCLETNEIFTSQRAAEMAMDLTPGNVSKQIAGLIDHANSFHFERICLAA